MARQARDTNPIGRRRAVAGRERGPETRATARRRLGRLHAREVRADAMPRPDIEREVAPQPRPVRVQLVGPLPARRVTVRGGVDGDDPLAGPDRSRRRARRPRLPAAPAGGRRWYGEGPPRGTARSAAASREGRGPHVGRQVEQPMDRVADQERRRLRAALEQELRVVEDVLLAPVRRDLAAQLARAG